MTHLGKKLVLGGALGATLLTALAPAAEAQDWRWHRRWHHDDTAGVAVVAGVAGLALGAALANDHRYDYDRRFYAERGYYPVDGYWYRHDYYPRYYRYYDSCYVRRVWDPYIGHHVMVRYCD